MLIETHIPLLEETLAPWRDSIGADYEGYRNHVYRMLHFCFSLLIPSVEDRKRLTIAAVFHDIGIWSAHKVDYLAPSIAVAQSYLVSHELEG